MMHPLNRPVWHRWLALPALCAGLLAPGWLHAQATNSLQVGALFPDLAKYELEGQLPASLKGKVVVVDFWASWCGPCQKTFPLMEELHHRYSQRGLVILAVNEDRSRAAMDEFLKEHPVAFAVVRDAKRRLAAEIHVPALPTSYLLDGSGRVRSMHPGARIARNRKDFVKEIEALLEEEAKKP